MRVIYKYPIEITYEQIIKHPMCGKIRHVGLDPNGQPCVWMEVNTECSEVETVLYTFATGEVIPEGLEWHITHVGSFVEKYYVWHVYAKS